MLKELAVEESDASSRFEPDLHIEDLRKSLGAVSFSVPWEGQGGWARARLQAPGGGGPPRVHQEGVGLQEDSGLLEGSWLCSA